MLTICCLILVSLQFTGAHSKLAVISKSNKYDNNETLKSPPESSSVFQDEMNMCNMLCNKR